MGQCLERICERTKSLKAAAEMAYWDLYFTIGYSCVAGAGNGLAAEEGGFSDGFGEGFVNNFGPGLAVNAVYPVAFRHLQKTEHFRRNALGLAVIVNAAFIGWHYLSGTEHPFAAALPNLAIGLAMTDRYVTESMRRG